MKDVYSRSNGGSFVIVDGVVDLLCKSLALLLMIAFAQPACNHSLLIIILSVFVCTILLVSTNGTQKNKTGKWEILFHLIKLLCIECITWSTWFVSYNTDDSKPNVLFFPLYLRHNNWTEWRLSPCLLLVFIMLILRTWCLDQVLVPIYAWLLIIRRECIDYNLVSYR